MSAARADFSDSDSFFENEMESDAEHPGDASDGVAEFPLRKAQAGHHPDSPRVKI
jgi:hypothetical protein